MRHQPCYAETDPACTKTGNAPKLALQIVSSCPRPTLGSVTPPPPPSPIRSGAPWSRPDHWNHGHLPRLFSDVSEGETPPPVTRCSGRSPKQRGRKPPGIPGPGTRPGDLPWRRSVGGRRCQEAFLYTESIWVDVGRNRSTILVREWIGQKRTAQKFSWDKN